jgi:hypothetical protein
MMPTPRCRFAAALNLRPLWGLRDKNECCLTYRLLRRSWRILDNAPRLSQDESQGLS